MEDAIPPATPPPPSFIPPPPVIVPPSQSRAPKRGRGWMVFAIVLLVLLGFSMLLNVGHLAGSVMHGGGSGSVASARSIGPRLDEAIVEDNSASSKIAVVEVNGIITGSPTSSQGYSMVDVIKAQLDRAQDDRRVKSVILRVDSPGGEVLASDEISEAIKNFQAGKKSNGSDEQKSKAKPVIVYMGNLAASGGYYISAPCRYIVANKMTITGSIGVIMHGWNYRGLLDKVGVVPDVYKSGKFKDMMSGSRETNSVTQEERDMMQGLINEVYGDFKDVVEKGRKEARSHNKDCRELVENWTDYADGRILSGTEAEKLGFVDKVGNFEDAVDIAKNLGGITGDANLIEYQERRDLSDLFHLFGESKAQPPSVKLDLGFDAPRLQEGHLYFLWSPIVSH
jgi:protease-4